MAFGDAGRAFGYAVRTHRISATLLGLALTCALVFSLLPNGAAGAASTGPPSVLIPSSGAYFGTWVAQRGGESREDAIARIESQVGRKVAIDHQYYKWDTSFPTSHESWAVAGGRIPFINWKAQRTNGQVVRWAQIASGAEDTAIAARADAIKAFGAPLYLTFHHEPEDDLATWGTPSEYAAAIRRIVDVFRSRGVTNVAFVWTMMAWTFDPRSGKPLNDYYPGNQYVDLVGSDGYNWYPGRTDANWASFQTVFQTTQDFAVAHNKPWMAVEYGVMEDPSSPGRKAQWFRDMVPVISAWPELKGLIYFDEDKLYPWITDSSSGSMSAYAQAARSAVLGGSGGTPPPTTAPPTTVPPTTPPPTTAPPTAPPTTAPPTTAPPTTAPTTAPPTTAPPTTVPPTTVPPTTPPPTTVPTGPLPLLWNSLNGGSLGASLTGTTSGGSSGIPFDGVAIESGASLTYDNTHTRGGGLSARHVVGPRQNAFYRWDRSLGSWRTWYGRVYVWFDTLPNGDLRLVRGKSDGVLTFALDLLRDGRLRVKDQSNRTIAQTWTPMATRGWVRIEWRVDHVTGQVDVRLYNSPNSTIASDAATSGPGQQLGSTTKEVQIGRSGTQPFSSTFWTDDPALSLGGFLGPV